MAGQLIRVDATIAVGGDEFDVLHYRLEEALCEIGALTVEIARYGPAAEQPEPANLVGKDVQFKLARAESNDEREYNGMVELAERRVDVDDVVTVVLRVVPHLWRLTKRADCRIFQEQNVQDIVTQVLEDAGVTSDTQDWKVTGSYPPRTYCTQYRETDFEFIQRLLAEEGIWFAVHMADGQDKIVLCDDPGGAGDIEGETDLPYDPEMGAGASGAHVTRLEQVQSIRSDKVYLKDYDPLKPATQPEAKSEGTDDGEHALEVYSWPGRFTDDSVGSRYAEVLQQSMQAERDVVRGRASVLSLAPGLCFSIDQHPFAALNGKYLVAHVRLEGGQTRQFSGGARNDADRYECAFEALPTARVEYRPPRREPARIIPGLQTVWTTGPSGDEIHVDEHGQVKAQFHWDRLGNLDDKSSTWMRTSQLATGGAMLLPRVGWETTVAFREGDADQPYVMGRLYNGVNEPPYKLPDKKSSSSIQTATTPGGGSSNELRMGDDKGAESMFMNASYDMTIDVNNSTTSSVGNNLSKKVSGNHALNVTDSVKRKVGAGQTLTIGGNQALTVNTYMVEDIGGSHSLSIGGNRTMMTGGDHKKDLKASSSLTVNGMHIDLVVGSVVDSTLANMNHTVGTALVEITAGDRAMVVGPTHTETTGAVKIIAAKAGRGVQVSGALSRTVGGAIINSVKGNRDDSAGATWTEIAAGAQLVKADNIVFEAEAMLSLVMGASVVMMMPAMIMVTGVSAKLDGDVTGEALTLDL